MFRWKKGIVGGIEIHRMSSNSLRKLIWCLILFIIQLNTCGSIQGAWRGCLGS